MPVSLDILTKGQEYTRPELAELWGYAGYEAISRGAVTPRNTPPYIILFITREKQEFMSQYDNQLISGILEMEGKTNHTAGNRIIDTAARGDEIHLFYRARHHSPFIYYGQIRLIAHERHTDIPNRFRFDQAYGANHARGYIEEHHAASVSKINGTVEPEKDLIPLCSNCHSMAHRNRDHILTLDELKKLIGKGD